MGFNSYTHTICIDNAVEVTPENKEKVESPSQVVTYSSKFVERLSDVVSSMNISYSAAIQKGTIEVSGNGNSIDEDKIKASDINLVISVQVINQTTTLKESARFLQMEGIRAGSPEFNDAFGDCYISGACKEDWKTRSFNNGRANAVSIRVHRRRRLQQHHFHALSRSQQDQQRHQIVSRKMRKLASMC